MRKLFLLLLLSTSIVFQSNAQWKLGSSSVSAVSNYVTSGSKILAGTRGYGIYSSSDNGATWTKTSYPSTYAKQVAVSGNSVFAASWGGGGCITLQIMAQTGHK